MLARSEAGGSAAAVLAGIAGLYVAQSVIGGLTWTALPAIMRDQGVPLDRIGLVSLIALPWAIKFLWSPAVERYRLPAGGGNRSGNIVLAGGLVSIAGLIAIGMIGPAAFIPVFACLTIVAFAAATVDIACDGYAVQALAKKHHGWGNAAQVGGAYLGSAIGAGLFLVLAERAGWTMAIWSMAGILVLLGIPFLLLVSRIQPHDPGGHRPSLLAALARSEIRRGLAAAALYVIAQKASLVMLGPFMVDAGFDLATLGMLNGIGGMTVGLGAALAGGGLVRVLGIRAVLALALCLQAACLGLFAAHAATQMLPGPLLVAVAVASSSGVMALGFVALYAQFMRWSDPRQAGVDFTLFQCMDALVSMGGGTLAGIVANAFGYGWFFAGAAAVATAAVPLVIAIADRD
ncbi:MAG: MFS transporter [Rhizobiaceae bacterium]|nr:MFS transporter [Rhizobiaceae bacterium]MCV0405310.1 MFS transporter [Rhizobiaceae bacterium]